MFLHTEKTPGLAHLSYVVGDSGHACVIDPQLDCQRYIEIANEHQCKIVHILETHRNEDFISGAHALAQLTGATVWHGPHSDAHISYAKTVYEDDCFNIGKLRLCVLETPGHTFDSVCYSLFDTNFSEDTPVGVFTGDTLFIGDVGRTDFYPGRDEHMAGLLYRSLQKLVQLGDQVQVFPAHGAGSVCGSGMADREFSTIGYERRFNPPISAGDEQAFIARKVAETHYQAPYFQMMENANVEGVALNLSRLQCQPLSNGNLSRWLDRTKATGVILDVRDLNTVKARYIQKSLCLHGPLISAYAGWFLAHKPSIMLVAADYQQALDAHRQLMRMGIDTVQGYTTDVPMQVTSDDRTIEQIDTVAADSVRQRLAQWDHWTLLDVRKAEEVEAMPMPGSTHIYLGHLAERYPELPPDRHYTVMCGSGKRATAGASFLKAKGYKNVDVFTGSMMAWQALNQ